MRDRDVFIDHESADPLLPWFVNGTLARHEHELVERHAAGCEECQDSIALLTRMRDTVRAAKETPIVPQARPEVLLDAIDTRHGQRRRWRGEWIAAASVGALLTMSAMFLASGDRDAELPLRFETATSNDAALPMDYVLTVRFEDGAAAADRDRVLQGIGAKDISTTEDASVYRVVVALPAASLEDLERYAEKMESLPGVRAVKPLALQIPVSRP